MWKRFLTSSIYRDLAFLLQGPSVKPLNSFLLLNSVHISACMVDLSLNGILFALRAFLNRE